MPLPPSDQPVFSQAHHCAIHSPRAAHGCAPAAPQAECSAEPSADCWAQRELVTAPQRYSKTLLKGTAPKAALLLWAMAPRVDVIIQPHSNKSQFTYKLDIQLVPSACRWLHITQPPQEEPAASPLCLGRCFTQYAVAGTFQSTRQQLTGWFEVSDMRGQCPTAPLLFCTCLAQDPWIPSHPGETCPLGFSERPGQDFFSFTNSKIAVHTYTHTQHTD